MQKQLKTRLFLLLFLVVLLIFVGLVVRKFLLPPPVLLPSETVVEAPSQAREILLYFATSDGIGLEAQVREIEGCLEEESCLRATLQALIDGPVGGLVEVLPPQTKVQRVAVVGGLATVSFNPELVAGHPGGSMTELLTVHALANTLAVNFPHIRQVQIWIDGAPLGTLKGHVDLREPIAADFDFGRLQSKAGENHPGGE
jgi:spore germination protein GerM